MNPKVDKATCIGCGTCASLASEVFKMDADGKASVIENCEVAGKEDVINQAKDACPVQAISVE